MFQEAANVSNSNHPAGRILRPRRRHPLARGYPRRLHRPRCRAAGGTCRPRRRPRGRSRPPRRRTCPCTRLATGSRTRRRGAATRRPQGATRRCTRCPSTRPAERSRTTASTEDTISLNSNASSLYVCAPLLNLSVFIITCCDFYSIII